MFHLGRSPCSLLLIAVVFIATAPVASAFMPPQTAAAQPIATPHSPDAPIAQAFSGLHEKPLASAQKHEKRSPKDRQKAAAYSHHRTKTPPLRRATNRTRMLSLLQPTLLEPPKPQSIETHTTGSLIDPGGLLQRLDSIIKLYRATDETTALRGAIDQRVQMAMRIAELDASACRKGPNLAQLAIGPTGRSHHDRIARSRPRTTRHTQNPQNAIANIDRRMAQLQRQRETIDRQLIQLDQQRETIYAAVTESRNATPINSSDITTTATRFDTNAEAERLIDAITRSDAVLKRTGVSHTERNALQKRRADLVEQLTAVVMRSCGIPTGDTTRVTRSTIEGAGSLTELRGTIRELRSEIARVSDELLRAQQGLVNRFNEIERRTNIIEAEIRSRLQRHAEADDDAYRPTDEHTALSTSDL